MTGRKPTTPAPLPRESEPVLFDREALDAHFAALSLEERLHEWLDGEDAEGDE